MDSVRFRGYDDRQQEDHGGGGGADENEDVPCFLDIYVHDARNIHNICIYANQDVYAKFSLTSAPDHAPALSTRVAAGAGASPSFHERLPPLPLRRDRLAVDVLKCELWMRSCAKPLLDDQLLGFALVPLADVAQAGGARIAGKEFELSSTDLFHSPAGTVRLSLALHDSRVLHGGGGGDTCHPPEPSITSEVVILDHSRVEFPDLNVVKEEHDMAVQYLPFLQLGHQKAETESMDTSGGDPASSSSDGGSKNDASTTTTASDNKAVEKPLLPDVHESTAETPTSSDNGKAGSNNNEKGDVFTSPLEGIGVDAEQSEMQRQIMDMYVRSMQQFSDSLAKVKMPVELAAGDNGAVVQRENEVKPQEKQQQQPQVRNDGARVFYGSRAFF